MKVRFLRCVSTFLICNILFNIIYPTITFALTSGPSQPEVQSFQAVGNTDMVDLFTGDFSYNIPLMDVGGYPINMSYQSGVTMDQESSWVGLGWNINPGVINRNMRGVPDDFNGDIIKKEFNIKPNKTGGVNIGVKPEVFGKEFKFNLTLGLGLSYNNYSGFAMDMSIAPSINLIKGSKGTLSGGLGIKSSSQDGLSVSPNVSFEFNIKKKDSEGAPQLKGIGSLGASTTFNSRSGLKSLSLGGGYTNKKKNSFTNESYISFGTETYVPQIQMPMINSSITLSAKLGGAFIGIDGMLTIAGYYSSQSLATKFQERPSYGYFNSEKGISNSSSLHDYNREKDASYTLNTPRLPITNYTYDLYSINGHGISGMFRPYRSDVGYIFDPSNSNTNDGYSLGGDFSAGNLAKAGFDFTVSDVNTNTRKWSNSMALSQNFEHKIPNNDFEPYYLKQAGDLSVDDDNIFYNNIGKDKAIRPELFQASKLNVETRKSFIDENGNSSQLIDEAGNNIRRNKRKKRNQNISFLNIEEAAYHGVQKNLYINNDGVYNQNNKHHIGEISVLKPDGSRYVFGLPAYNILQEEVTFATGQAPENSKELPIEANSGLVKYDSEDNTIRNNQGLDNYFSKTTLPAYAHSYMITSVLSADFVDNDGIDGPSVKDAGNYTLFKYSKVNNYQWRIPFEANKANANQGLKSIKTDDQANYIYGKKELLYVRSIESKNYIAIFNTSDRQDGVGVLGENGGASLNGSMMRQLDNIKLYYKNEYDTHGTLAKPLKSVFFKYDYALCKGIPNHKNAGPNMGKLTLREVYFTYQDSDKGRFSPYHFDYCYRKENDNKYNPSYNGKAYDRWGNYKPIDKDYIQMAENSYTTQSKADADVNAGAWSLTNISLPSGGSINVNYEADDYAFIQDKKPGLMVKVAGFSNTLDGDLSSNLYTITRPNLYSSKKYIGVDLPFPATSAQDFKIKYLDGLKDNLLYFRIPVNMTGNNLLEPGPHFEYVSGYGKIDPNDIKLIDNKRAVIKLNLVSIKEKAGGKKLILLHSLHCNFVDYKLLLTLMGRQLLRTAAPNNL